MALRREFILSGDLQRRKIEFIKIFIPRASCSSVCSKLSCYNSLPQRRKKKQSAGTVVGFHLFIKRRLMFVFSIKISFVTRTVAFDISKTFDEVWHGGLQNKQPLYPCCFVT